MRAILAALLASVSISAARADDTTNSANNPLTGQDHDQSAGLLHPFVLWTAKFGRQQSPAARSCAAECRRGAAARSLHVALFGEPRARSICGRTRRPHRLRFDRVTDQTGPPGSWAVVRGADGDRSLLRRWPLAGGCGWRRCFRAILGSYWLAGDLSAFVRRRFQPRADGLLTAQPIVFYNLPQGFYLRSSGVWNFDFQNNLGDIPVGLGAGKVMQIGKVAANSSSSRNTRFIITASRSRTGRSTPA